ncbi:hypothetical protein [Proteiniphilum sp. X52]|uniref:hypothetical protein n=1 Tax=Proteiniphilum sp. X52 TaxID=2382159 RepID=UPI001314F463|nr:hypothetical protein [Proteiniphilum sp. X52]
MTKREGETDRTAGKALRSEVGIAGKDFYDPVTGRAEEEGEWEKVIPGNGRIRTRKKAK